MALRILHTSDLHGNWRLPMQFQDFDVWVDTGDTLPNISRGESVERTFQQGWLTLDRQKLRKLTMPWLRDRYGAQASYWYPPKSRQPPGSGSIVQEWTAWLHGRPAVVVPGNHDFTSMAVPLARAGAKAWDVTTGPVVVDGEVFAGFREIPYMIGEWAGEAHDTTTPAKKAMKQDPTVLLTHSPPMGILDYSKPKGGGCGIPYLTSHLSYRLHRVKAHLFGHVHEQPETKREMGILFSNAAQTARIIEVE